MTDMSLMRGDGWVRCVICGELHKPPWSNLYRDRFGSLWDVCKGHCAQSAGVSEGAELGS